jgi:hypothetical protein
MRQSAEQNCIALDKLVNLFTHSAGPIFTIQYLGEFETEWENILGGFNLGPRGNRLLKKIEGWKSRDTVSLQRYSRLDTTEKAVCLDLG